MNNAFFAFISRMKYINRWGLMHNSRYENLSEHSFETAYIANALASIENTMFGGNYETERITTRALFHDSAENNHGRHADHPSSIKAIPWRTHTRYRNQAQKKLFCAV